VHVLNKKSTVQEIAEPWRTFTQLFEKRTVLFHATRSSHQKRGSHFPDGPSQVGPDGPDARTCFDFPPRRKLLNAIGSSFHPKKRTRGA